MIPMAAAAFALAACSSGVESTRMWIGPELVECEGVAPMMCMQVAYAEDDEYQLFYEQIEGFTHEEGSAYVIDVSITEVDDPPADASSLRYTLIEVIDQS